MRVLRSNASEGTRAVLRRKGTRTKQTTVAMTSQLPYADCTHTLTDEKENTQLTVIEQNWLENLENQHLAYSHFDLHF